MTVTSPARYPADLGWIGNPDYAAPPAPFRKDSAPVIVSGG